MTRHDPSALSTADSMVVFGIATLVRLSAERTGAMSPKMGLGEGLAFWASETAVGSAIKNARILIGDFMAFKTQIEWLSPAFASF